MKRKSASVIWKPVKPVRAVGPDRGPVPVLVILAMVLARYVAPPVLPSVLLLRFRPVPPVTALER